LSKLWIKICGITRPEDTRAACALGIDALGANFYPPSPRAIAVEDVATIFADVPESVLLTALFVNPEPALVESVLATGMIDRLQFHGDETPEYCASFGVPYFKALRVGGGLDVNAAIAEHAQAELILLDSFDKKAPGGTGKTFDWSIAKQIVIQSDQRIVLAGGLHAGNVAEAIEQVRPYGVDVSSGVESSPGIKCPEKLKEFVRGVGNG
jgi:phosphoribosylanthranilate isomerase